MQFDDSINENRPVPILLGNGRMATMIGKSGYHDASGLWPEELDCLQELVVAGRRLAGPRYPLIPFGRIESTLLINGVEPEIEESRQTLHTEIAEIRTRRITKDVLQNTRTLIFAHRNALLVESRITNHSSSDLTVAFWLDFKFGTRGERYDKDFLVKPASKPSPNVALFDWESQDNLGVVFLCTQGYDWIVEENEAHLRIEIVLPPAEEITVRTVFGVSDRLEYQDIFSFDDFETEVNKHFDWWRSFWQTSEIITGIEKIDRFREISLYTLASQATPWSIPPSLTEKHWSAGAFHDEYYPFMALLTNGYKKLAQRIPFYRLSTLQLALQRGNMKGALYPWSATEKGEERDPHGHWYTERFHLGQIAACAWNLWTYDRDDETLSLVYPIIKECARYFENEIITRDSRGKLITKPCTDFDESVGQISSGPFTMAAAVYTLDRAAEAAVRLGLDYDVRQRWQALSKELSHNFPVDLETHRYIVPANKSQHISILGYIAPFFCDVGSEFAYNSARYIYEHMRTDMGWKPGVSQVFDRTSWMWTAGHLAMCLSVLGDGDSAWDVLNSGPNSAGQFMSPNEHLNASGIPVVPWFTTGCGAWLTALSWMFARVDDDLGDRILPSVPRALRDFSFRGLGLSHGLTVSAKARNGKLIYLSLTASEPLSYSFEIPSVWIQDIWQRGMGKVEDFGDLWRITLELLPGENTLIEETQTAMEV